MPPEWKDSLGRPIKYLRVSVTDRCNLRCRYCMPAEGIKLQDKSRLMSYEEITEFARIAAARGIRSIRLTGGEPLTRRNLPRLIRMLSVIPGIEDISLTTNGTLLADQASELRQAGLKRVNISLDTLDSQKYAHITRGGSLEQVWRGIRAAQAAGLKPIKLNCVALRGFNDNEFQNLALLTREADLEVRFIEYMPITAFAAAAWGEAQAEQICISAAEIMSALKDLELQPLSGEGLLIGAGPARMYQVPGWLGRIGFITPQSRHFCANCNRLRLTAEGSLRLCLLNDLEIPILSAMRNGQDISKLVEDAILQKPAGHNLALGQGSWSRCMSQIGG